MTTIVASREMMVADSLASTDNVSWHVQKIFRVDDALVGVVGEMDAGLVFVKWYTEGADEEDRPYGEGLGNITALVLDDTGIYRYEANCMPMPVLQPYIAFGSGADAAMAAMHMGAGIIESVHVASKIDLHTSGPVVVEHLHNE